MFEGFFSTFPILFVAFVLFILISNAWQKRDLFKGIYSQVKTQYDKDVALARPNNEINFVPVVINIFLAGFSIKLFLTDFDTEMNVFFNIWFSFFLLLLNFPIFIYKENKDDIYASIFLFIVFSLFCFPILLFYKSPDLIYLSIGWLFNYIGFLFFSNSKQIDNLQGQTGLFLLFWVFIILISIVIHFKFDLPDKYNYGYLINVFYFILNAFFAYSSQKYDRINTNR